MTRDNEDRLRISIIAEIHSHGWFEIEHLALNMDQIRKHKPPPNPAKDTDIRFAGYIKKFGRSSWELDALDPKVIGKLIGENIKEKIEFDQWSEDMAIERKPITQLQKIAEEF